MEAFAPSCRRLADSPRFQNAVPALIAGKQSPALARVAALRVELEALDRELRARGVSAP